MDRVLDSHLQIFLLPACSDSEPTGDGHPQDKYTSSNFDKYNRAFEDNGARLDLQVHNQEGGFNPMLVIAPQGGESPDPMRAVPRPVTSSPSLLSDTDGKGIPASPATVISQEGDSGFSSSIPLGMSSNRCNLTSLDRSKVHKPQYPCIRFDIWS